jgi:crotonobetainyl-CoA:carnitine CoA-transferase CaiB-like acyl-CoA transferase
MLEGLKVVEFSTWVAGPSAAMVMADWGAEVIKVEPRTGDPVRNLFAAREDVQGNPVFDLQNRGKRSLVLDTGTPEGREALLRVLATADIFITNLRPGALKRARLDYASIKADLPRLIYTSVSGYGLEGDGVDLPAFDIAALWTRSGVAGATIPEGVDPFFCRPGMGDSICALATAASSLAAVIERNATGKGREVETSLIRTGSYAIGWDLAIQLKWGEHNRAQPRTKTQSAVSNYFKTSDGHWVSVSVRAPRDWPAIAATLDHAHLVEDPRFATPAARMANARELMGILDAAFAGMDLKEASARLTKADVIWAPLQSLEQVVEDPYAQAAGCFVEIETAGGERHLAPASPARLPGEPEGVRPGAPPLGAHTREILAEAGYGAAEIDALVASGAATALEAAREDA